MSRSAVASEMVLGLRCSWIISLISNASIIRVVSSSVSQGIKNGCAESLLTGKETSRRTGSLDQEMALKYVLVIGTQEDHDLGKVFNGEETS